LPSRRDRSGWHQSSSPQSVAKGVQEEPGPRGARGAASEPVAAEASPSMPSRTASGLPADLPWAGPSLVAVVQAARGESAAATIRALHRGWEILGTAYSSAD